MFPITVRPGDGVLERREQWLPRAKCSSSTCRHGFTVRPAEQYPRRQFQLDAVAGAVASVALGDSTAPAAAATVGASERSVRRWTRWVARLADLAELCAAAARLDGEASVGAGLPAYDPAHPTRSRAAQVLVALEHFGAVLRRRGLVFAVRSGLALVLIWQHVAHGVYVGLVAGGQRLSPGLAGFSGGAAA